MKHRETDDDTQWSRVLAWIWRHGQRTVPIGWLELCLDVSPGELGGVLDRLKRGGLIETIGESSVALKPKGEAHARSK